MKSLYNIEIFKAGTFTDAKGEEVSIDAEGLQQIANEYNNKIKEDGNLDVPVIKGHDTNSVNAAEGWVKKLYVKDNSLYADFDVNDEIYNQIKEQKYKKISICIEKVDSNNYILKHIGLLGAAAPAVAGMQSIELNEKQNNQQYIFTQNLECNIQQNKGVTMNKKEKLFNDLQYNLQNFIKGLTMENENVKNFYNGLLELLNKLEIGLTEEQISSIQETITNYFNDNADKLIVEVEVEKEVEETEASEQQKQLQNDFVEKLQKQIDLLKSKVADSERQLRYNEYQKQADQLVQDGKLKPNTQNQYIELQEFAFNNNSQQFNFTQKLNDFINNSVYTQNLLKDNSQIFEQQQQTQSQDLQFTEWDEANPELAIINQKVNEFAKKQNIDFVKAFDELQRKGEI